MHDKTDGEHAQRAVDESRCRCVKGAALQQADQRPTQHDQADGGGDAAYQGESQRARHGVSFAVQVVHFAQGSQGGEDDDAHRRAEQGLGNLHETPAPIESAHRADAQPRGDIVHHQEVEAEYAEAADAREHQADDAPKLGIIQSQLKAPSHAVAKQPRQLYREVQGGAQDRAESDAAHAETGQQKQNARQDANVKHDRRQCR